MTTNPPSPALDDTERRVLREYANEHGGTACRLCPNCRSVVAVTCAEASVIGETLCLACTTEPGERAALLRGFAERLESKLPAYEGEQREAIARVLRSVREQIDREAEDANPDALSR